MMDPWKLENIRKSFEAGSPLAQGAALHKLQEMANEIAKLREENERLREAMNQIAEMANWQIGVPTDTEAANEHARIAHTMAETARASALAKEPTP